MKLNKKGITLVELIISIALISIVLMFLFRLLVDVRYGQNNTDYNRKNQQTRAIIMKTIQTDFLEKKLIGLKDNTGTNAEVRLEFRYADGTSGNLFINSDTITYQNSEGTEKWLLEKETDITQFDLQCISYNNSLSIEDLKTQGEFFSVKFTIPVVVNKTKKNYIDDLEFFYIGEKKDLESLDNAFPTNDSLGNYDRERC